MKERCADCERKRHLYKPVVRYLDGTVGKVCKSCWETGEYYRYVSVDITD